MSDQRVNLLGLPRPDLEAFFVELGEKPFRARQIMNWIYRRGVGDFEEMTDLSQKLRQRLAEVAEIRVPRIVTEQHSADGTRKWMLGMGRTQGIETVFIPEPSRGTLCISSQVGCVLDCSFCSTAQQGFNRNLSTAEIVGQVWLANREMGYSPDGDRIVTNVVLMGMGEPLANYRAVIPALHVFLDDFGFGLSRRRVTLSTSGIVPMIERLGQDCNVALAVSLHAPDDHLRDQLVPINRRYPIAELLEACWRYASEVYGRFITFEYVMLDGVNDQPSHARALARLLKHRPGKVNLIPFNPFPGAPYRRSPVASIERFREILLQNGVRATIRKTRGEDIDAACGQLAGQVKDRTRVRLGSKLAQVAIRS
ncbi:MAG: 23S rRNA (adenine(2503)-C(2))-methyltransferase RlmN [Gammaproteobacteria bacterium]